MTARSHTDADTEQPEIDDHLDPRDCRALAEPMFLDWRAPDLYDVRTESGGEYVVDLREPACTCPDFRYRDRRCKHLRRVALEVGDRDPEALAAEVEDAIDRVDDRLAALARQRAELTGLRSAVDRFRTR